MIRKSPDPDYTRFSRYSHEEIVACLDKWYTIAEELEKIYPHIPDRSPWWEKIYELEEVSFVDDRHHCGARHGGSQEKYPIRKWEKLIKQHERLLKQLREEGY